MKIQEILDILVDPITKNKLILYENYLTKENYIEHYEKDAEVFDYFQTQNCKATADDERRLRTTILSKLGKNLKNKNILDIGSGGGWADKSLTDKCKQFISVDISDINLRKQFDIINKDNYFPIQADALNLPFADNSIDIVISF